MTSIPHSTAPPRLVKAPKPLATRPPVEGIAGVRAPHPLSPYRSGPELPPSAPADQFPYWMVWKCRGASLGGNVRRIPRYRHATPSTAEAEAARLAASFPGKHFLVVRVEAAVRVPLETA